VPIFGFFDYNRAGKGIAKDEPEKRPFFKYWELFGRKFWKFFHINFIYVLFCLPVVTFGPATVAMTQVMRKFTLEQPIFIFDEFWKSFKRNFKQGLAIGLFDIFFIIAFVIAYEYYGLLSNLEPTIFSFNTILLAMTMGSGAFILMMHFYIYAQITSLTLTLRQIIKNSVLLAVLGLKGSIVSLLVAVGFTIGMVMLYPLSIFMLPFFPFAWVCFTAVFNTYPVIQKYIITPFYEARGEKNPEIPDYGHEEAEEDGAPLFEDMGGREAEIKSKPKPKGRVIK
jgi:uncharacterized membrane protein YesL